MAKQTADTRKQILQAALKQFAQKGYAGASVQDIVAAARVAKPALYYYFRNKADLYRALVDWAFEERFRLMQEAAAAGGTLPEQLTAICGALFEFVRGHRDLMRLAFATAFAAPGEVPPEAECAQKGRSHFDFVHGLFTQAAARGELGSRFDDTELAMGFFGVMHLHIMAYLIKAHHAPDRRTAQRLVELFLAGARSA